MGRLDSRKVSFFTILLHCSFPEWGGGRRPDGERFEELEHITKIKIFNGKLKIFTFIFTPFLLSSSAEGWRSSFLRKTSWVPELRSRTTSAILQCLYTSIPQESPHPGLPRVGEGGMRYTSIPLYIHNYPSSGLRPPSPAKSEGIEQGYSTVININFS